jgi:hypothetical protein
MGAWFEARRPGISVLVTPVGIAHPSCMKRLPAFPLAWTCALLIALVLLFAGFTMVTGRQLEREATDIQADAVPGLINAHRIRGAYAEGFGYTVLSLDAPGAVERAAMREEIARLDAAARAACDDYVRTILINPQEDMANFRC